MHGEWTGELVIGRLEAAFRRNPDAAMYSVSTVNDLPCEGPIEGSHLIQATALALGLDSPARIHLLYHARARCTGEPIYKLCQIRSWKRPTHYRRVIAASITVAEWLNARAMRITMVADTSHAPAKRGRGRPPTMGIGTLIGVRCHKEFLTAVDKWRVQQEGDVSRSDAIRRLAELGLKNL